MLTHYILHIMFLALVLHYIIHAFATNKAVEDESEEEMKLSEANIVSPFAAYEIARTKILDLEDPQKEASGEEKEDKVTLTVKDAKENEFKKGKNPTRHESCIKESAIGEEKKKGKVVKKEEVEKKSSAKSVKKEKKVINKEERKKKTSVHPTGGKTERK